MRLFSTTTKGLVIAAATAFLMACGGGSPADKMMAVQEKVISIIEDNKSDLDKAAKLVGEYLESNKESIKAMKAEMEKMGEELEKNPEKMQAMMEEFGKKQEALEKRMEQIEKDVPGIKDHAGLKSVMRGMPD